MLPHEKNIINWRNGYKEVLANWSESINPVQKHYGELIKNSWQRAKYISRNLPFAQEKLVICPPNSILNMAPNQQHRGDYGTGSFEGSSVEPVLDANNKITGLNVILHAPRMARFVRSLHARNVTLPMPIEQFAHSVLDLVAIHGADVVTNDDGTPTRAYIRPSAGPGVGAWGVTMKPGYYIEASNIVFRWGSYFPAEERIKKTGAHIMLNGTKRTFPITGKHASNYGAAASDGGLARQLEYDEFTYLAPYGLKNGERDYGITSLEDLLRYGVLADGPGEEIFAILKDETTLIYPSMHVNRLGGTVLDYVTKHLAPALGLKVCEQDITLEQIRNGEIVGLGFAGNAVKITPIGKIDWVHCLNGQPTGKVETLVDFGVHPIVAKIRDQFAAELSGKKPPSHESLLTPIDLKWGQEFREYLDDYWRKLGF